MTSRECELCGDPSASCTRDGCPGPTVADMVAWEVKRIRKEAQKSTPMTSDDTAAVLRRTTEAMANLCSVDMALWNEHSNAALGAADLIERQAAEIERLKNPWRPISEAPRDETKVLAYCFENGVESISVIWWRAERFPDSEYKWRHARNDSAVGGHGQHHLPPEQRTWRQGPTHWMPLPPPPVQE